MERCKNSYEKSFIDSSHASNFNFEIHSSEEEEEATIAFPMVHNILHEAEIKQKKEQKLVHFQEGEHYCLSKISLTTTLKPWTIVVYIEMSLWPFTMMGRHDYTTALKITLSRG
jgi:hypothetical protein